MATRIEPLHLAPRLLAAWLILSIAGVAFGPHTVSVVLPLLTTVIEVLQTDFIVDLILVRERGEWLLCMQPFIVQPLGLGSEWVIPPATRLGWFSIHLDHTLAPVIVFLSLICAWPFAALRELAGRIGLGVPALLVLLALDAPVHLIGLAQMFLAEQSIAYGAVAREPWGLTCMIFLESGGRWLLSLAAAVACICAARRLFLRRPTGPLRRFKPTSPAGNTVFPPV